MNAYIPPGWKLPICCVSSLYSYIHIRCRIDTESIFSFQTFRMKRMFSSSFNSQMFILSQYFTVLHSILKWQILDKSNISNFRKQLSKFVTNTLYSKCYCMCICKMVYNMFCKSNNNNKIQFFFIKNTLFFKLNFFFPLPLSL